jgi:hypothetical protein
MLRMDSMMSRVSRLGRGLKARLAVAVLAVLSAGCGGGSKSVSDLQVQPNPRPAYGSLNLVINSPSGPMNRQLFLDLGQDGGFKKSWPQVVPNHQDNQALTLWRYDFIEPNQTAAETWYATLLVRVDDTVANTTVSFFARGGTYPVNKQRLNPMTLFPNDVPETPENKMPAAIWLYLRKGNPVQLVDPSVVGRTGPYGSMPDNTTVAINLPGLDFPVGGASLMKSDSVADIVGNTDALMDNQAAMNPDGTPVNPITTPATTLSAERVPTTNLISRVTSQWDMLFAWQPPQMGVTLTHGFVADGSTGGDYSDGQISATGGGFFLTMNPGASSPTEGINTLNWTILRSISDPVWVVGWSADVAAASGITRGQSTDALTGTSGSSGLVRAQVRGYLAGLMSPSAKATVFQGAQDRNLLGGAHALLFEGQGVPMIGRTASSGIKGQFGQLLIGGRSLWFSKNGVLVGADVQTADQTLTDRYGTTLTFSAYLPIP